MRAGILSLEKDIEIKKKSQLVSILRRFSKNRLAVVGAAIVIILLLAAVLAPIIAPFDPNEQHLSDSLQAPNGTYWFGTDQFGRDIFSRVLFGARISLLVGFGSVALGAAIGSAIGAIAGYFSGIIDNLFMRFIDILLSIPPLLLAISIAAMMGIGLINTIVAISIGMIGSFARITRASVLTIKGQEYIEAVSAVGASNTRIILKHILPNIAAPLIVQLTLNIASAILAGAGLSFIGLGVQPPTPEWGSMLAAGRQFIRFNWWLTVFPGIALMLIVYGFNMMGDGLRDALDPRLKN